MVVHYTDAENYSLYFSRVRLSRGRTIIELSGSAVDLSEISQDLRNYPSEVVISGYGVIGKNIGTSPEIADKIKAAREDFVWSESYGQIFFVRREQIKTALEQIKNRKAKITFVRCWTYNPQNDSIVKDIAARHFSSLNIRELLRPTLRGSVLAMGFASRLKFYIMGLLLIVAASNALLWGFQRRFGSLHCKIAK